MWAIGNGQSRIGIDVDRLPGPKAGCNAIFRDYKVDYLVCVDKRMMNEAIEAGANQYALLYTRPDWYKRYQDIKRTRLVPDLPEQGYERPDDPFHWGSGPYAVLIAAMHGHEREVNLIGFDLYSKTKTVNNVYKGTQNYDDPSKRPVDPRYWIYQIGKVFDWYPKTTFTIYQEEGWELPKAWNKTNVKVDNISNIYYNT